MTAATTTKPRGKAGTALKWPKGLPCPADNQPDLDWHRGRDLALAMVRAGEVHWDTDDCEPRRRIRNGAPFNNFADLHLRALIQNPEILRGFATVLSAKLGVGDALRGDDLELAQAEYLPGLPGEDGTEAESSGETATNIEKARPWREEADEIRAIINEGMSIVLGRLEPSGTVADLLQGAIYAARIARDTLDRAESEDRRDEIENASAPLSVAQSVLDAALANFDDLATWGALRLLEHAKERLDAEVERAMRSGTS